MFFTIKTKYTSPEHLRTSTLLDAYFIIKNYPLHASEILLDRYIQQKYKVSLKDMCINLLLKLNFSSDAEGNLILVFKERKYDDIASLITYGNGAIPGSNILRLALSD